MSKAALFAGLGQGLMALGQGAGQAIRTMSLEKLRQQNLEKNWARQSAEKEKDWARQSAEKEKDREIQRRQIASLDENRKATLDLQRSQAEATAAHRTVVTDLQRQGMEAAAARAEADAAHRTAVTDLQRQGMEAEDTRWSAGALSKRIDALDKSFHERAKALQETMIGDPEGFARQMVQLEAAYKMNKLAVLESAPENVLTKSGLKGDFQSLSEWAENNEVDPVVLEQMGGDDLGENPNSFLPNRDGSIPAMGGTPYGGLLNFFSDVSDSKRRSAANAPNRADYRQGVRDPNEPYQPPKMIPLR